MDEKTVFYLISEACKKAGVSCVLIGGFALNHYKVTRVTADLDFLITEEDFKRISGLLEGVGYRMDACDNLFARFTSINPENLMDIDFLFVDRETFVKIMDSGEEIIIAGQRFIVASLDHMIALKLHALKYNFAIRSEKDMPDIINLIRIHKIDVRDEGFKELCLKYGTQDIYKKILERVVL